MSAGSRAADEAAEAAQRYSPRPLTDGERWTAEALGKLRRGGYRPRAWVAFLRSSLERSGEARRQRPGMARQARAWAAAGGAAWLVACGLTRTTGGVRLRPVGGLAWWLAVWRMLDWHLGMAEGGDGRPRSRLAAADAVTLVRFWLVPALPGLARCRNGLPAVILLGGATDWLDGELARRQGRTRLGRDLDTTADLAFLTAVATSARAAGRITPVGFAALTARHGLGVALALGAVLGRARRPAIRARRWGAVLRFGGLALSPVRPRAGTAVLVAGCLVPPRATAAHLSPA